MNIAAFYSWAIKEGALRTVARNRWTWGKVGKKLALLVVIVALAYATQRGFEVENKAGFAALVVAALLVVTIFEIALNVVYVIYEAARGGARAGKSADIKALYTSGLELLRRIKAQEDWDPEHVEEWEAKVIAVLEKGAPNEVFGFKTFGVVGALANNEWDTATNRLATRLEKLRLIIMRLDDPPKRS